MNEEKRMLLEILQEEIGLDENPAWELVAFLLYGGKNEKEKKKE